MKKFLTIFIMAFSLVSCGGKDSDKASKDNVIYTFNLGEEGKTIDPTLATSSTTTRIHSIISEGLTRVDRDKSIKPGLAKSWDVSEDGLTWTFHLRDNIKWSNGDDIKASDFKFSWLRALDPNTASEYAYMLYVIKGAEEYNSSKGSKEDVAIKVIDDKTLEVSLKNPTPYFESLVSFITYLPINEKFYNEKKDEFAVEAEDIVSSGPYYLKTWEHNSKMEFVKNPNYYNPEDAKLDKIVAKFIQDSSSELNAFKNDELDMAKLLSEQIEEFKDDDRLVKVPVATVWYLEFNTTNKFLSNKNIRKAILTSLDKESIVKNVFRNSVTEVYNLTPKGLGTDENGMEFVDAISNIGERYNVEKSKQFLEKGLKELGLSSAPEVSIILNDGGNNKKLAEAIQEEVRKNLGITINIELMTFKERLARMQSKNFDIVLAGWGADYQDPMTFLDLFVTGGGNNHTAFTNKAYDEAIKKAGSTSDKKVRFEAFKKAEEILADEAPIAPLFQATDYYLLSKKFKGHVFPSVGTRDLLRYVEKVK